MLQDIVSAINKCSPSCTEWMQRGGIVRWLRTKKRESDGRIWKKKKSATKIEARLWRENEEERNYKTRLRIFVKDLELQRPFTVYIDCERIIVMWMLEPVNGFLYASQFYFDLSFHLWTTLRTMCSNNYTMVPQARAAVQCRNSSWLTRGEKIATWHGQCTYACVRAPRVRA